MKKIYFLTLLTLILGSSCDKEVLDKAPLHIINDAVVWSDETLINAYLTEIYGEMVFFVNDLYGQSMYASDFLAKDWFDMCMTINLSDEATDAWVFSSWKYAELNDGGGLLELWPYDLIRRQNYFIEQMENGEINPEFKKEKIAEARFLRAFTYFSMVKRYGGVPLITEVQYLSDPEEELYPRRNKEVEVYDFILSEMEEIQMYLPEKHDADNLGRPTKYAALALKSRAGMYAGSIATWGKLDLDGVVGIPPGDAEKYWTASYEASKAIIESGRHGLYNNYQYIFLDENNEEVIFSKLFNGPDGLSGKGHGWDLYQSPMGYNPWGGGNQSAVYLEMVESYEYIDGRSGNLDRELLESKLWTAEELWKDKDPRFAASVYTQGTPWKGNQLQFYYGLIVDDNVIMSGSHDGVLAEGTSNNYITSFGILKYLDPTISQPDNNASPTDWIVFRYGEVLMNHAEVAFELGKAEEALEIINKIRKRAGISMLTEIDRDKIRQERKVELAFENHRFWDLRRWRIAHTELSGNFSGLWYVLDYDTGKFKVEAIDAHGTSLPQFSENKYYFPIGRGRRANNPNLIENPGY